METETSRWKEWKSAGNFLRGYIYKYRLGEQHQLDELGGVDIANEPGKAIEMGAS